MGLFGSSKKTYVSSAVYNMAGDIKDRPDYLKTLITSRVLEGKRNRFATDFLTSYVKGPGIELRRFGRWARLYGYNQNVGIVQSTITLPKSIDFDLVDRNLEQIIGNSAYIIAAETGSADYAMWAAAYMLENRPDSYRDSWVADYNPSSNQITITITPDDVIRFTPQGFSLGGQYLYVSYNPLIGVNNAGLVWTNYIKPPLPLTNGYILQNNDPVNQIINLTQKVTVTQRDGNKEPVEQVFNNVLKVPYTTNTQIYFKREELPSTEPLITGHVNKYIEVRNTYTLGSSTKTTSLTQGSVITTTITEEQYIIPAIDYRTGEEKVQNKAWGKERIYIYRRGSGNAELDSVFQGSTSSGEFFPNIPLRIDNKFVDEINFPAIYPWVKKAIHKSTNTALETLLDQIKDNPSIKDIDYTYVVFGVSLNTIENTAKRYLYEFFRSVGLNGGTGDLNQYWIDYEQAMNSWSKWVVWFDASRTPNANAGPEPTRIPFPQMPKRSINIRSSQNYDMTINFSGMEEVVSPGLYKAGAKINDLTISRGSLTNIFSYSTSGDGLVAEAIWSKFASGESNSIIIQWQDTATSYRKLVIHNLEHINNIYNGKSVVTSSWDALQDPEESGFIVPLHEQTLRNLPIPVATQMSTASTYLVFNSYQVVKKKWYQTGIFKVVLVIIMIVIAVYSGGAGAGGGGLLGSNAAVGTTIGFTGTAAIVAGAIANAVVAMVVVQAISKGSQALFGEKVGSIIGAIASIVAINVGTSMASGQGITASFGSMMKADNIMMLANSVGNGVSGYIQASAIEVQQQTQGILEDYQKQSKEIAQKYMDEFGGTGIIDPLAISGVLSFSMENPNLFLDRTMMTGTDVANLSMDMIDNFVDMTLSTNLD